MAMIKRNELETAEIRLTELLTDFAESDQLAPAVHEIVEEYRNSGAHEQGRELFAYILENWNQNDETNLELQVGLALQSIKIKDDPNTQIAIDRLIADYNEHPNIAKALSQIAEEYLYAKNYQRAIELWELTETDYAKYAFPSKDEVPYLLATCYKRLKEYDHAIEYYEQMLQRYPRNKFAYRVPYRLGMIYMREKDDYETAVYWYAKQNELYDNELLGSRALRHQGHIYAYKLEDYENAKACYEKYVTYYPNGASIWGMTCNLARCHEKLGNPQEAVRFYKQALGTTTEPALIEKTREKLALLQEGEEQ
jgi:tetratricopeptide (TPR) repeat protein